MIPTRWWASGRLLVALHNSGHSQEYLSFFSSFSDTLTPSQNHLLWFLEGIASKCSIEKGIIWILFARHVLWCSRRTFHYSKQASTIYSHLFQGFEKGNLPIFFNHSCQLHPRTKWKTTSSISFRCRVRILLRLCQIIKAHFSSWIVLKHGTECHNIFRSKKKKQKKFIHIIQCKNSFASFLVLSLYPLN